MNNNKIVIKWTDRALKENDLNKSETQESANEVQDDTMVTIYTNNEGKQQDSYKGNSDVNLNLDSDKKNFHLS